MLVLLAVAARRQTTVWSKVGAGSAGVISLFNTPGSHRPLPAAPQCRRRAARSGSNTALRPSVL